MEGQVSPADLLLLTVLHTLLDICWSSLQLHLVVEGAQGAADAGV
jgi:hypothetical protein